MIMMLKSATSRTSPTRTVGSYTAKLNFCHLRFAHVRILTSQTEWVFPRMDNAAKRGGYLALGLFTMILFGPNFHLLSRDVEAKKFTVNFLYLQKALLSNLRVKYFQIAMLLKFEIFERAKNRGKKLL